MPPDDAVSASAQGAKFLILLQIGSRAVTFGLNQLLLRFLSPQLLGIAVQLELYTISTLYFARESLRIATQRRADGGVQAAVNLSYISLALGLPLALLFALFYRGYNPDAPYVFEALAINGLSALVELCSEPAFVAVQQTLLFKIRAAAEATAVVAKTLTTAGLVLWAHHHGSNLGVLPFAAGELAYSACTTVVLVYRTAHAAQANGFSLFPVELQISPERPMPMFLSRIPLSLLSLAASIYVQTGIKWLLTEGDKILIAFLATLEDQGMYAVSANYGGLIARMLFRPIEESCRTLFGNLCAEPDRPTPTAADASKNGASRLSQKNIHTAATILRDILRIYTITSVIVLALGPTGAPLLLELVAGSRWSASGAGAVLGTYSGYIPIMALNGVSEAFVAATATTADLRRQSAWMAVFSAAFAASAWLFVRAWGLGARGLVFANCVNLGVRIVFNLRYARTFFAARGQDFRLVDILPSIYTFAAAVPIPTVLQRTQEIGLVGRYGLLGELVRVGGIAAALVMTIAVIERGFLLDCYRRFKSY